ncbi:hypothetical protein NUSPORA_00365 [Nucleospora cyclopteri]
MAKKSVFDDLLKSPFILAFSEKNKDFDKLNTISSDCLHVDLSVSKDLKMSFMEELGLKRLPVVIYKRKAIYAEDNFEKKFDEININFYKNFVDSFTSKAKYAVFIKGTIENPYCKYTKQLVSLLKEFKITDVVDFDIFTDEDMRYYLKQINSWETYPMIYVNGNFLGGLDVFKRYVETEKL